MKYENGYFIGIICLAACNCHPAGVSESFGGCDTVAEGQLCECKERVAGEKSIVDVVMFLENHVTNNIFNATLHYNK